MMNLSSEESKLTKTLYDRHNPYLAPLVECKHLTKKGSSKEILHIVCDLRNSDIVYEVGSSFGILPENLDLFVDEVVKPLGEPYRNFLIQPKNGETIKFEEFLKKHANLSRISSQFLHLIEKHRPNEIIEDILSDKVKMTSFCESNNLATFLSLFWHPSIPLQELVDLIFPMLPRYYSVASSMKKVGEYAHFMVASFFYPDAGRNKESVTASYLKFAHTGTKLRLFLQPNPNFRPPEDLEKPIIMIGPGTGLASLRGFLQEREATNAKGKNWLFTGDRQKAFDFHYEEELTNYVASGMLKLSTAFSRDSETKIYVQDLMLKEAKEIWSWIINENASIYICGDAKSMAKDVQKALHFIAESEGQMSSEESKAFFKALRHEKRLLLDIY
jgi:sulfite reductase (NADPH) flavoprotein alpha-component